MQRDAWPAEETIAVIIIDRFHHVSVSPLPIVNNQRGRDRVVYFTVFNTPKGFLLMGVSILPFNNAGINDDEALNTELAQAYNVTPPFKLQDFNYDSDRLLDVIFGHLERTSFKGLTVRPYHLLVAWFCLQDDIIIMSTLTVILNYSHNGHIDPLLDSQLLISFCSCCY